MVLEHNDMKIGWPCLLFVKIFPLAHLVCEQANSVANEYIDLFISCNQSNKSHM
jgi:hypothetical protein